MQRLLQMQVTLTSSERVERMESVVAMVFEGTFGMEPVNKDYSQLKKITAPLTTDPPKSKTQPKELCYRPQSLSRGQRPALIVTRALPR